MTLWISKTLLRESFRKTYFILMMLFILFIDAFTYNLIFDKKFNLKAWLLLKNLDFSKMLLLGLGRIEWGILKMSTCFLLVCFLKETLLGVTCWTTPKCITWKICYFCQLLVCPSLLHRLQTEIPIPQSQIWKSKKCSQQSCLSVFFVWWMTLICRESM